MLLRMVVGLGAMMWCAAAGAAPPTLEELLKPGQHTLMRMSPDGSYVAATSRVGDRVMLAIINRRTNKLVRVLDPGEEGRVESVVWATDERLFLMKSRPGVGVNESFVDPEIVSINVDGTRRRAFYASVVDMLIDDSEHILIARCARQSSKGCWNYVQRANNDGRPVGPRVAEAPMVDAGFVSDNRGEVRFAYSWNDADVQQLWLLNEGSWTQINDEARSGIESIPIGTSRDGRSGFLRSEHASGPDVIERIEFATGTRSTVMSDPKLDPLHILWSADGTQPIGAAYGLGVPRARFWDPSDPDAKLIVQLEAAFPEDSVALTSGTRDGQHSVVSVWSDVDPGSYYLLDRASKRTSLVARATPWLSPDVMAPARPISFTTRDGIAMSGYLTLPLEGVGRPPLIVLPHGGPFGVRDAWRFDEEVQILAAHGYAVLRVNFRGSDGLGRSFEESGFLQWGLRMQDDVTDATRWAISQGHAEAGRICIWGTSYGGYAALMGAVREPDLYKCVVATAAVTDLNISWKWGSVQRSRWGRHFMEHSIGKDPKQLREVSPVKHAGSIRADVLLVHGKRDSRVSFEHAKAMLAAFELAKKPIEHDFFTDETHGIHGDENRQEYYQLVLAFLDARLGPSMLPD